MTRFKIQQIFQDRGFRSAMASAQASRQPELVRYVDRLERERVSSQEPGFILVSDLHGIFHAARSVAQAAMLMAQANRAYL